MPKDNNQTPTTTPTTNNNDQSPIFVEETLPPMPQEQNKQDIKPVEIPTPTVDTGSASPQDEKIMPPIVTASKSKKKFTRGKVIATILGLFLIIGGAGAGVFLVKQNQNINEKAVGCSPAGEYCGGSTTCCNNLTCTNSICVSTPTCSHNACMSVGGSCCSGFTAVRDLSCGSGLKCNPNPTNPPSECVSNGRCLGPGEDCCGNDSYTDNSCTPTTTRCGIKPTTPPTAPPVNECEDQGGTCRSSCNNGETRVSQSCVEGSQNICCKSTINPLCATQIKCNVGDTTCSVGTLKSATCYVNHYKCDDVVSQCGGTPVESKVASASLSSTCGTEQIDLYCEACKMTKDIGTCNGVDCQKYTYRRNTNSCTGVPPTTPPTAPPTAIPGTGSCSDIKAYNKMWTLLSPAELSSQKAGDTVIFCVAGSTSSGSFDKGKFTINGIVQSETTATRPGSQDFCQTYSIPYGVTTFNITSQIHFYCRGCAEEGWK